MSVNNKECWSQQFHYSKGVQVCGGKSAYDESAVAKCEAESVGGKLTVRVYTDLDSNGKDESFAIDNVTITPLSARASYVVYGNMYVCMCVCTYVNMIVIGFDMVCVFLILIR